MALILNQPQAEAVYSAMCALNNVGGTLGGANLSLMPIGTCVTVFDHGVEGIRVGKVYRGVLETEWHDNQSAFATAYGLNPDEPQSAVAAAAGGLTQTAIER